MASLKSVSFETGETDNLPTSRALSPASAYLPLEHGHHPHHRARRPQARYRVDSGRCQTDALCHVRGPERRGLPSPSVPQWRNEPILQQPNQVHPVRLLGSEVQEGRPNRHRLCQQPTGPQPCPLSPLWHQWRHPRSQGL